MLFYIGLKLGIKFLSMNGVTIILTRGLVVVTNDEMGELVEGSNHGGFYSIMLLFSWKE